MNIEQFEAMVRNSVEGAKERGWTIASKFWFQSEVRRCCPLGAVMIEKRNVRKDTHPDSFLDQIWPEHLRLTKSYPFLFAEEFGMSPLEVESFIQGFDGRPTFELVSTHPGYWNLGRKFREELLNKPSNG